MEFSQITVFNVLYSSCTSSYVQMYNKLSTINKYVNNNWTMLELNTEIDRNQNIT